MSERPETSARGISLPAFLQEHGQLLLNIYLFLCFSGWIAFQTYRTWDAGRLNYTEIAFAAQNLIFVLLILLRMRHRAIDRNILHQAVAVVAFYSGIAFIGKEPTGGETARKVSDAIVFSANLLGAVSMLNLGRSFGILISRREIKTRGLYSVVRHPMYGTDILLRIGYLVSHMDLAIALLFAASTVCYVYRAILEERFLRQDPAYEAYMRVVRYRFIPGIL